MIRAVSRKLARGFGLVAAVLVVVLVVGVGLPFVPAIGWAVGSALLVILGWSLTGLFTNPVDLRYLRTYLEETVEYDAYRSVPATGGIAGPGGAQFCFTLVDDTAATPVYDVFAAGDMVVCRSRSSGSTSFYSRLDDGRILCTDRQLSVPNRQLVLNVVRSPDAVERLRAHRALVDGLSARDVPVREQADPGMVLDHLEYERDGFRQLGAVLGCALNVDGERAPLRLLVDVPSDELLALALIPEVGGVSAPPVRRLHVDVAVG